MSKRDKQVNAGLNKKYTLHIRQELLDNDDTVENILSNPCLTDEQKKEALEFLNQFNEEWVNGRVYPSKDGRYQPKFHTTDKDRKIVNDMNNKRNNDVFAVSKSRGMLKFESDVNKDDSYSMEDALNEKIDEEMVDLKNTQTS